MPKFSALKGLADANLIENGAVLHLISPQTNEPLTMKLKDGTTVPCRAKVRSFRSKAYQAVDSAIQQEAVASARRARANERKKAIDDAIVAERSRKFIALLVGLENCSIDQPGYIEVTPEDAQEMYDDVEYEWLVSQVMSFATEDQNFGPAVGNAPPPAGATSRVTSQPSSPPEEIVSKAE